MFCTANIPQGPIFFFLASQADLYKDEEIEAYLEINGGEMIPIQVNLSMLFVEEVPVPETEGE